ncbi:NAD(P)H-dependent oxidoreductase [Niabella ginsenosidivorans]|uniref:NAD(P)H-dependent oxidoreductase n=1 Tax=Niabella ginsenosidivorans TaxID=1176587 RepID=A0A1A9I717_9BACT|nr:nitroreductase family protein [Niabella ginsenosidivorans]ANH83135.1 NAD(P)H-dependent oxidoreductase [Niabella ginsenosidivorans]
MTLLENLMWRYATKKMNGQPVPQEKINYILEAVRLAPSSAGIQPYKVFVISNKEKLEQIKIIANNQSQIADCSHLLVFAAWDSYSYDKIDKVASLVVSERNLPENAMDDFKKRYWSVLEPLGQEWHKNHAAKQAYIALGIAVAAAAEQRVDATPMEGFDAAKLDMFLGLDQSGLKSVVILPLGYRDEQNDWLVNLKKVRTPKEEFITEFN